MQKRNLLALFFLSIFVFSLMGCDGQKTVVDDNQKKGLSPQERKEKRGE